MIREIQTESVTRVFFERNMETMFGWDYSIIELLNWITKLSLL